MNLQEIITRPSPAEYSQQEMEFVVTEYIKTKKGVDVEINLSKHHTGTPLDIMLMREQIRMLDKAFEIAQGYFLK